MPQTPGHGEINASKPGGLIARVADLFSVRRKLAAVPDGVRVYAVGDIHGCATELDRLTDAILRDSEKWEGKRCLVYIGDYVDRGPDSKGVIDRLLEPPRDFEVHFLRGNHDQMLLDFLRDPAEFLTWRDLGARQTLLSYGVLPPQFESLTAFEEVCDKFRAALPREHLVFFEGLRLFARIGDYYFAHAGVRPGVALNQQSAEDLLWIRDEFLISPYNFGMIVVHGHTPTDAPVRRSNRIGIDTGAYVSGKLTAAVFEGTECRFLTS